MQKRLLSELFNAGDFGNDDPLVLLDEILKIPLGAVNSHAAETVVVHARHPQLSLNLQINANKAGLSEKTCLFSSGYDIIRSRKYIALAPRRKGVFMLDYDAQIRELFQTLDAEAKQEFLTAFASALAEQSLPALSHQSQGEEAR